MSHQIVLDQIKNTPLFKDLSDDMLAALADSTTMRKLAPGDVR
jgi:hypothetical protein